MEHKLKVAKGNTMSEVPKFYSIVLSFQLWHEFFGFSVKVNLISNVDLACTSSDFYSQFYPQFLYNKL